jgi:antitoxin component YwqK of YwqJK toxin-antitoxin module
MTPKIFLFAIFIALSATAHSQTGMEINKSDQSGKKQGRWVKYYPNGNILYEGTFRDNHPVGELIRYYDNKTIKSVLLYSTDGKEVFAKIYHSNGFISSKGKYVNQLKEGKWQFFSISINGYLILEEYYTKNLKNGTSVIYYPDSTIAEKVTYLNDLREGQCIRYYPNGSVCLKSQYSKGMIDGKFEVLFESGNIQILGWYRNDMRDGPWIIYNNDGTIKYKLEYALGNTTDRQMDIDESNYIDSLQANPVKIADPEKTGAAW